MISLSLFLPGCKGKDTRPLTRGFPGLGLSKVPVNCYFHFTLQAYLRYPKGLALLWTHLALMLLFSTQHTLLFRRSRLTPLLSLFTSACYGRDLPTVYPLESGLFCPLMHWVTPHSSASFTWETSFLHPRCYRAVLAPEDIQLVSRIYCRWAPNRLLGL